MNANVLPQARQDILRQYRYYLIEQDAEAAAERFLVAVETAMEAICKRPGMGVLRKLDHPALAGLRTWPIKGFPAMRVYYLQTKATLTIVRVLHGKRDIDSVLAEPQP